MARIQENEMYGNEQMASDRGMAVASGPAVGASLGNLQVEKESTPSIPRALDVQSKSLGMLQEVLNMLEKRLSPVLRQEPTNVAGASAEHSERPAQLVHQIEDATNCIQRLQGQARSILARLEV